MASKKSSKQRTLHLISSLDPDRDDERTAISKKISWILRRGAKVAGVKQDDEGWVTLPDLLEANILEGMDKDSLMQVIVDSNGKKLRYELKESNNGDVIRAYTKADRKARESAAGVSSKLDKDTDGKTMRKDAQPFDPNETPQAPVAGTSTPAASNYVGYPATAYPGYNSYPNYFGYPGYNPWAMNMVAAAQTQQSAAMAAALARTQQQAMMHYGRVKSYNPDKGFGFIECHQTFQHFRRDVFLHKSVIGDTNVGDVVWFTCDVDQRGMPQATRIETEPKGGKGKGKGEGKGKDGKGKDGKGKDGKKGKSKDGKQEKKNRGDQSGDVGDDSASEKKKNKGKKEEKDKDTEKKEEKEEKKEEKEDKETKKEEKDKEQNTEEKKAEEEQEKK